MTELYKGCTFTKTWIGSMPKENVQGVLLLVELFFNVYKKTPLDYSSGVCIFKTSIVID